MWRELRSKISELVKAGGALRLAGVLQQRRSARQSGGGLGVCVLVFPKAALQGSVRVVCGKRVDIPPTALRVGRWARREVLGRARQKRGKNREGNNPRLGRRSTRWRPFIFGGKTDSSLLPSRVSMSAPHYPE